MYEQISKHRAGDMLDAIGAGRIIAADPDHHKTQEVVASLERAAQGPRPQAVPVVDESQWDIAAAMGGIAVIELPVESPVMERTERDT